MDTVAATRLAAQLDQRRRTLCEYVSLRLLQTYPTLIKSLRLEEGYTAESRLSVVAVERLNELVRAMLLFDLLTLADQELGWASGVLPRHGVTYEHQSAMVRYFFDEVRKFGLGPGELTVVRELECYLLDKIKTNYYSQN